MYKSYLDIYAFAIAIPGDDSAHSFTPEPIANQKIPLENWFGKKHLWTYRLLYFVLYALMTIPFLILGNSGDYASTNASTEPVTMSEPYYIITLLIVIFLIALLHGSIVCAVIRRYHKKKKTMVYKYGKQSYDNIYPKGLRRLLWVLNVIPFIYLTFFIVPIMTRLEHFIVQYFTVKARKSKEEKELSSYPRLDRYGLIKRFIEDKMKASDVKKTDYLDTLKILFERRISEIRTDVQRISIILSSLGIVISLFALIFKGSILELIQSPDVASTIVVLSVFVSIVGVGVFYITQLQIQIGKNTDLSTVLDVIDTMRFDK